METLSIKVSKNDKARLHRLASERKISLSALLREGLEHVVTHAPGENEVSCYGLGAKYLEDDECLGASGHKDLSTNKAHLKGFGL
ncbi:MAG: hypothetical protein GVY36_01645 [Verrucomicrobia bacterium]|jgi:hypothetical protein|nr:hypothetical protein [Verrucomicrobiota bacterium]